MATSIRGNSSPSSGKAEFSSLLTTAPKQLHTERVRLKLPAIGQKLQTKLENKNDITDLLQQISKPKTKIKLDPVKALEPYRKKLTNLESQRVIGILDELLQKCEIIAIIPHLLKDIDSLDGTVGDEIATLLNQHRTLLELFKSEEQKFHVTAGTVVHTKGKAVSPATSFATRERFSSIKHVAKTDSTVISKVSSNSSKIDQKSINMLNNPSQDNANRDDVNESGSESELAEKDISAALNKLQLRKLELETSIKNIMRAFRSNDVVLRIMLQQYSSQKSKDAALFCQCLVDLKAIILERLLISPIEQQEKLQFMAQVAAQDQHNQMVIDRLEQELAAALEERDTEVMQKNDVIKTLQHSLRNLESATEDDIRRAKTEAEKQIQTDNRASDSRKQKLTAELKQLNSLLQATTNDNRDEELVLRKKKWKIESEIENWLQKYDEEMSEKQDEYEEIDAIYQEEKKQLVELEQRFSTLEAEYQEIMKKKLDEKNRREASLRLLEKQTQAALTIQAVWRAFVVRKALKNKLKKKRGGKRKKKN